MNKKHSELEMFMRKFMNRLGLGYQCHYTKNFDYRERKSKGTGNWLIEIWDQRPGHYIRRTKKNPNVEIKSLYPLGRTIQFYNPSPSQKWYNNQDSDTFFDIKGPTYEGDGYKHKDDFLKWLLFENDFFKKICDAVNPGGRNMENSEQFCKDFETMEIIHLKNSIIGNDLTDIFEEFEKLKKQYNS